MQVDTGSVNRRTALLLSFLAGLAAWFLFITWGHPEYRAYDWYAVHQWLDVYRQAFDEGLIPYHATYFVDEFQTGKYWWGNRFFASPYIIASPHVLLLSFIDTDAFLVFHLLLMFSLSFLFLVRWAKDLDLSGLSACVFAMLACFNGALVGRMSVGHLQLTGYMFIPGFIWVVWKLVNEAGLDIWLGLKRSLQLTFLLFFILLQGSLHVVYQMIVASLVLCVTFPRRAPWLLFGIACFGLLSVYFFIPNTFYGPYSPLASGVPAPAYLRIVFCGYGVRFGDYPEFLFQGSGLFVRPIVRAANVLYHFLSSLVIPYTALADASWTHTLFVGWPGFVFLCLGVWGVQRRWRCEGLQGVVPWALSAAALFFYASDCFMSVIFAFFQRYLYPLPAIDRVATNMMLYPFFAMLILSAWGLERAFREAAASGWRVRGVSWGLLTLMAVVLGVHLKSWFVIESQRNMPGYWRQPTFFTRIYDMSGDIGYVQTVNYSYIATTAVFAALLCLYLYSSRNAALAKGCGPALPS